MLDLSFLNWFARRRRLSDLRFNLINSALINIMFLMGECSFSIILMIFFYLLFSYFWVILLTKETLSLSLTLSGVSRTSNFWLEIRKKQKLFSGSIQDRLLFGILLLNHSVILFFTFIRPWWAIMTGVWTSTIRRNSRFSFIEKWLILSI